MRWLGLLAFFLPTFSFALKCSEVERIERESAKATRDISWNSFNNYSRWITKWSISTVGCATSSVCLNCMWADDSLVNVSTLTDLLSVTFHINEIPMLKRCRELPISWMRENFSTAARRICHSSGCTKIKGMFQDQPFILRGCWEKLWREGHFLPAEYDDCQLIPFEPYRTELKAEVCVCRDDLCNRAATAPLLSVTFLLFLSQMSSLL